MTPVLTRLDHAKYPFTIEASEYVKSLNIDMNDLTSKEFSVVLDVAEERIKDALITGKIGSESQSEVEILAYPAALMLLAFVGDERSNRRYALAESKRAYELLRLEPPALLLQIAQNTFGLDAKILERQVGEVFYEFALSYRDYLRNAVRIREPYWKLTNRILDHAYAYCDKDEFARLLKEEVEGKVLSRIARSHSTAPEAIVTRVERIARLVAARAQSYGLEETPRAVLSAAMPPCMRALLSSLASGKHIPHMGRFALTSFLSNVGVTDEEIVKMLSSLTDFSERMTRYQVEHISGRKGTRKKYTPPSCKTMKTHGLCVNPDQICTTIAHPLAYYRKRARTIAADARRRRIPRIEKPVAS